MERAQASMMYQLHRATWQYGRWVQVQGNPLSFLHPPTLLTKLYVSVCARLSQKNVSLGSFVVGLGVRLDKSPSLCGPIFLKWGVGTDDFKCHLALWHWVKISIPQNSSPLELWLSRIQVREHFVLYSACHKFEFLICSFWLCSNGQKRNAVMS